MIEHAIATKLGMWLQAPSPNSGDKLGEEIGREVAKALQEGKVGQQVGDAIKQVPWHQVTVIGALTGVLVPLGFFTLIGLIIWMQVRKSQARTLARLELQKQLLDKFASGRELGDFLASLGGRRFLDDALAASAPPLGSSVRSIRTGTFLAVMGLGFLLLSWLRHGFVVAGFVLLAVGAGFLVSGMVSHRLSEKWAVKQDKPSGPASEPLSQN